MFLKGDVIIREVKHLVRHAADISSHVPISVSGKIRVPES